MTSTKPYLLRAIFEWAEDNSFTSQVLVNANAEGVEVPVAHVVDGQIVLNICSSAVQLHVMDNDCLSFSARFGGVEQDIYLPIESILAIFARENSQGIFFEEGAGGIVPEAEASVSPASVASEEEATVESPKPKTKKRNADHLKVIK